MATYQPSVPGVTQATMYDPNTAQLSAPGGATLASQTLQGSNEYLQGGTGPMAAGASTTSTGLTTTIDPVAAAAAQKAAEDAARAAALRTEITNAVNSFKSIIDSRYGQVDASAGEQVGKLNERFGTESADVTRQVGDETNTAGASFAARGTRDSSDYGNSVDTITRAGEAQIRDLGTELQDNVGKIGGWVAQQKAGFDAQKGGVESILAHLSEETNPDNLVGLRNQLDSRIAELKAGGANNNTAAQNAQALASIAPSSARAVQLKTTLSQIVAGNADPTQKAAIGQKLIQSAGLSPEEQQQLMIAFQGDLGSKDQQTQTV